MHHSDVSRLPLTHFRSVLCCLAAFAALAAACGTDSEPEARRERAEPTPASATTAPDASDDAEGTGTTFAEGTVPTETTFIENTLPPASTEPPDTTEPPPVTVDEPGPVTLNVAVTQHPTLVAMCELADEHFTAETGIGVNCITLTDQDLRNVALLEETPDGDRIDITTLGMFETPHLAASSDLTDLSPFATDDADYDLDDVFATVRSGLSFDGGLYAAPFYAESSMLMYRTDILEDAGLVMAPNPTWEEVAEIARLIHTDETAGICMRGRPGWGDLGAAFTTVLNTFGGTWWEANDDGTIGTSQVDQPEFAEALNFYVDLLTDAGPPEPASNSFFECSELYNRGEVAMWYDATVAIDFLTPDGEAAGRTGFVHAPTQLTPASGWLWAWALAMVDGTDTPEAAWELIAWATGKDFAELVADEFGSRVIPQATRLSTFDIPQYLPDATANEVVREALQSAPIDSPGTTPRPGLSGVQYVSVPEFQEMATRCTEVLSDTIDGFITVDEALVTCHEIASEFST